MTSKGRISRIAERARSSYCFTVNMPAIQNPPPLPAEKLALAQQAFREFHARCFWFMRPDAEIVAEEVAYLCERLRADGGRRGFFIAAELCR